MSNYQVISRSTHAHKYWKRFSSYNFAAQDVVVPMVAQELPRALMHVPIAFIKQLDAFVPVAVLGLQPGQNLFVTPDGRWTGGYTPAAFRSYPFQLVESSDGQSVLVIDEDSGLVSDTEGETFFDEEGKPAKAVKDVLDFLVYVQTDRAVTQRICTALAEQQLIQPWNITVQGESGERKVEGLYQVDEAAMNALPAEAFEALRQVGAVQTAYCQLLSMQHLKTLHQLTHAHGETTQPLQNLLSDELDFELLNDGGTISFGP